MARLTRPFVLMAKPASARCNIHCQYCFYVDKVSELAPSEMMSDEVLEAYVREYLKANPSREVHFFFQGGEPTLCGLEFFEKVVKLQQKYGAGRLICNHLQTNGMLLNSQWMDFLKQHNFLVGLSIDGPELLHDINRVTRGGLPTYKKVEQALCLLRDSGVEFNTLTVISPSNAAYGAQVFNHLVDLGARYLQFIPLTGGSQSLSAQQFAQFMIDVCDEWFKEDKGMSLGINVQMLDQIARFLVGMPVPLCVFRPRCGEQLVIEQNGDIYACDHFVSQHFKMGNILQDELLDVINSPRLVQFAELKSRLSKECYECKWADFCNGGCPAHRQPEDAADYSTYRLNSLCQGYQQIFEHVLPPLKQLLVKNGARIRDFG